MRVLQGGTVRVLTFKEGLLSRVAHDLSLRLERHRVATDGSRLEADLYPESLVVEGAIRGGQLDPALLSEADKRDIGVNIREKVLHTSTHPAIELRADVFRTDGRIELGGPLRMLGRPVEIRFEVRELDGKWSGEVELVPSHWGIQPFKALLGAIKVQDRVVVRFDFPVVEL